MSLSQAGQFLPQTALSYPNKRWRTFQYGNVLVTRAVSWGMPKINPDILNCTFYLYRSREAAESGEAMGGTGFLVGYPVKIDGRSGYSAHYAVTNWHVAVRDGFSVIRLYQRDGTPRIIELDSADWHYIDGGNDVAAVPIGLNNETDRVSQMPTTLFITEDDDEFGVGDDVFMVGRFIDDEGIQHKPPAARFGNISMMPQTIKNREGLKRLSCCLDMHSRDGFSGSPVFVYRTPGSDLTNSAIKVPALFKLLGIHWCQFPERWEIGTKNEALTEAKVEASGNYILGLSGMTAVVPAWEIVKLLNTEKLTELREASVKELSESLKDKPLPPVEESAKEDEHKGDEILERMLNTPPKTRD